jgi:hypothetical protein
MALCVCMVSGWHKKNIGSWARMSIYIYIYIYIYICNHNCIRKRTKLQPIHGGKKTAGGARPLQVGGRRK